MVAMSKINSDKIKSWLGSKAKPDGFRWRVLEYLLGKSTEGIWYGPISQIQRDPRIAVVSGDFETSFRQLNTYLDQAVQKGPRLPLLRKLPGNLEGLYEPRLLFVTDDSSIYGKLWQVADAVSTQRRGELRGSKSGAGIDRRNVLFDLYSLNLLIAGVVSPELRREFVLRAVAIVNSKRFSGPQPEALQKFADWKDRNLLPREICNLSPGDAVDALSRTVKKWELLDRPLSITFDGPIAGKEAISGYHSFQVAVTQRFDMELANRVVHVPLGIDEIVQIAYEEIWEVGQNRRYLLDNRDEIEKIFAWLRVDRRRRFHMQLCDPESHGFLKYWDVVVGTNSFSDQLPDDIANWAEVQRSARAEGLNFSVDLIPISTMGLVITDPCSNRGRVAFTPTSHYPRPRTERPYLKYEKKQDAQDFQAFVDAFRESHINSSPL